LAGAVGLALAVEFVPPLTREDRRSLAIHEAVAGRLREAPDEVLVRARRNQRRLCAQHPSARPLLDEWRVLLDRPVAHLIEVLRDPRTSARALRQVSPFAGVLGAPERARVYRRFEASEERTR
jgi:hypothetical protein